jgi:hypothetical protein
MIHVFLTLTARDEVTINQRIRHNGLVKPADCVHDEPMGDKKLQQFSELIKLHTALVRA